MKEIDGQTVSILMFLKMKKFHTNKNIVRFLSFRNIIIFL